MTIRTLCLTSSGYYLAYWSEHYRLERWSLPADAAASGQAS